MVLPDFIKCIVGRKWINAYCVVIYRKSRLLFPSLDKESDCLDFGGIPSPQEQGLDQ